MVTESRKTTETKQEPGGFLGAIEKIGNKLPDPFWLFVILSGVVAVVSWIGNTAGMSATDPSTGETIKVESLLTAENLSRMVTDAVENFVSFPPLGVVLAVMLGVAVAEYSGLLAAMIRAMVSRVGPKMLTFMIALASVTGSVASDAIYVIVIPLGAMAFNAIGRSPIVGAMVAFAASSAGFNASLILNVTDLLLAGISTSAAQLVDASYEVSPLANIFFVIPSAIVLSLIITAVTEFFVDKKAQELIDHDEVEFVSNNDEDSEPNDSDPTSNGDLSLSATEAKGLGYAGATLAVFFVLYLVALLAPFSPFARPEEGFMESPLIRAIAVPIALMFFLCGLVYGRVTGTISSPADIPDMMAKGLGTMLPMVVLFFVVSQFLAWFQWSNLGPWTAIHGAQLLESLSLPKIALFAGVVLMVAVVNLFITSGSAQWALMAPVLVPMMMYVGVAPEATQMLFRMGDSPSNIITPMSPYFALALTFLQRYYKKAGVGTLMSLSLPYALSMLLGWFIFFMIWYWIGIPLGPGAPMEYQAG
ncbi:AbgT family transporter [Corynebacterium liangguodongii]|uniref:AbgT family transporter n=1 Tax=Corynebacterium liangguodongii TaxID=2079535 RepID=UPI0039A04A95